MAHGVSVVLRLEDSWPLIDTLDDRRVGLTWSSCRPDAEAKTEVVQAYLPKWRVPLPYWLVVMIRSMKKRIHKLNDLPGLVQRALGHKFRSGKRRVNDSMGDTAVPLADVTNVHCTFLNCS